MVGFGLRLRWMSAAGSKNGVFSERPRLLGGRGGGLCDDGCCIYRRRCREEWVFSVPFVCSGSCFDMQSDELTDLPRLDDSPSARGLQDKCTTRLSAQC